MEVETSTLSHETRLGWGTHSTPGISEHRLLVRRPASRNSPQVRFSSAANYSDSTQTGVPHSSFAFFTKEGGAFDFVSAGAELNRLSLSQRTRQGWGTRPCVFARN